MVQSSNDRDAGVLKFENGRMLMTWGDGPEREDAWRTMPFGVHIFGWFPFPDDSVHTNRNENNRFTPVLPIYASLTRAEVLVESWGPWERFVSFVSGIIYKLSEENVNRCSLGDTSFPTNFFLEKSRSTLQRAWSYENMTPCFCFEFGHSTKIVEKFNLKKHFTTFHKVFVMLTIILCSSHAQPIPKMGQTVTRVQVIHTLLSADCFMQPILS
jgi:hypothetical protein